MEPIRIIGGGIVGTATAYVLTCYTNGSAALYEKEQWWGRVNTSPFANCQTNHLGRIESNYPRDSAIRMLFRSGMMAAYVDHNDGLHARNRESLLGVGEEEIAKVKARFAWGKDVYPELELLDAAALREVEPALVEGRRGDIIALSSTQGRTIDYGKVAASFVERATATGKLEILLGAPVRDLRKENGALYIDTGTAAHRAQHAVLAAGTHTLLFAHRVGVAKEYFELSVAGRFFYLPSCVNGKVYTIQRENLPFAAVHADRDLAVSGKTRFGPTALLLPFMECNLDTVDEYWRNIKDFVEQLGTSPTSVISAAWDTLGLLRDKELRAFAFENLPYALPGREKAFLAKVQKIVPAAQLRDLVEARDPFGDLVGGIRPLLIDRRTGGIARGVTQFTDGGLVCSVTPATGASDGLGTALDNVRYLASVCPDLVFDEERFLRDHKL